MEVKGGGTGAPHPLLDGNIDNDTVAKAPLQGAMIVGNSTPLWDRLPATGIQFHAMTLPDASGVTPTWGFLVGDNFGPFATPNLVLATLAAAGTGAPSFRALVNADLPTVNEAHGGTNQTTYTTGDIIYASAANTLSKLGIGGAGTILTVVAGVPAWAAAANASTDPNFQFLPAQNEPPTTNPATFTAVDAATGQRPYLEFDGTTDETAIMSGVFRNDHGGGVTLTFYGTMDGNNTGTKVVKLSCAFELVQSGDVLGGGGNDFASAQSVEITVNNTGGTCFTGTLAFTAGSQMDSVTTGKFFRFKITRNNSGLTGTNATGRYRMLAAVCNNT